jgi:hypothetical protein
MTDNNSSRSTPPPSSNLSRSPHPSSIPRLPPTPLLPYTPTTPLPSSRYQNPIRTIDHSDPAMLTAPFETQFQTIPEESIIHSNVNVSTSSEQQQHLQEHKETNQQPEISSNAQTYSNENFDTDQIDNNFVHNSNINDDIETHNNNTNDYNNINLQNNTNNMQQQQIQQQLFEQKQMFDKTMFLYQQRIQQLEQQILFSQQEAAQLKFDQAYYSQPPAPTTWYTSTHGTSFNNQSINSINNVISKAISKPDTFDGNATLIDSWIYSMRNYLLLANIPVEQQVPVVTTYLKGNAQNCLIC